MNKQISKNPITETEVEALRNTVYDSWQEDEDKRKKTRHYVRLISNTYWGCLRQTWLVQEIIAGKCLNCIRRTGWKSDINTSNSKQPH